MKSPKISLIAAISKERRALGFKNKLLWKIEGDLPRFKRLTEGHPVVMGRKTYESIGRPLPNRTNIVVSRSTDLKLPEGVLVFNSTEEALREASALAGRLDLDEAFVIGGGQIYNEALQFADRLYLTIVSDEPEADTFFPAYEEQFKITEKEDHFEHDPPFSFVTLERAGNGLIRPDNC